MIKRLSSSSLSLFPNILILPCLSPSFISISSFFCVIASFFRSPLSRKNLFSLPKPCRMFLSIICFSFCSRSSNAFYLSSSLFSSQIGFSHSVFLISYFSERSCKKRIFLSLSLSLSLSLCLHKLFHLFLSLSSVSLLPLTRKPILILQGL